MKTVYERWMWIELIGFDLRLRDFGVSALFDRAGFQPDAVTLLLSDPEFVHGHTGRWTRRLGPGICSYAGHPINEERTRQAWTARQLAGLVRTLQARDVRVFFTHFDFPFVKWCGRHPELQYLNRGGEQVRTLCPYKHLAGGQPYREFFLPLLGRVVEDYGFDGYHAGDGYAHPRLPIYEGDFSDDTVGQYLRWASSSDLPRRQHLVGTQPAAVRKRADWLWQEEKAAWIEFHRQRTLAFWSQATELLHDRKKRLVFNTCWTRDPFEAIYRYGVDYRALADAGVDAFLAETAAAAHEYGGDLPFDENSRWDPSQVLARFSTKLQLLRAAVPKAKIIFMNGIKDTNEAWNGIRHAPTNVESEIFCHTATLSVDKKGRCRPATDGVISVLSDGLSEPEWRWIRQRWDLGYSLRPEGPRGVAVYWSDRYPKALLDDYLATRRCPLDRIFWRLTAAGAPLLATVRPENLSAWDGPVLVIHPHLLPSGEWRALLSHRAHLIAVGGPAPRASSESVRRALLKGSDAFEVAVFKCKVRSSAVWPKPASFEPSTADEPVPWLEDLPARSLPDSVFHLMADLVTEVAGGIRVLGHGSDIRAWAYEVRQGRQRVYVRNSSFYYREAGIDLGRPCTSVKTLTAFPGNPVTPGPTGFRFKMAGKSTAIFEVGIKRLRPND